MAQLVARLVRNEKVGGSNPPSSTTGRHSIRMSAFCMPGRCCGACCCVALAPLVFRAPRVLCWAGLLGVPVGGGPPASRPRCEPSARRVVSKPGQAPPPPTGALRRPPHRRRLVADVWLGASACCPARPCHRPLAPRPASHVKPSSPLLACAPSPVKPTTPLQARYPRFRRNFGEQRRHGFHGGVLRLPHWC